MGGIDSGATSMLIVAKVSKNQRGEARTFKAHSAPWDGASILDRGIIDSTGVLGVIGFIEDTFGSTVEDSEMLPENLESIDRIANFVTRKKGCGQPARYLQPGGLCS